MNQSLYQKIYDELKAAIETGTYPPGSQLPTEKEISADYGVSRITSKRALTELEIDGYIYRVRGKGSFVNDRKEPLVEKTNRILFLLPFSNDLSLGNFHEGLAPILRDKQYDVLMTSTDYLEQKKAAELIEEFDGLIYYAQNTDSHLDILAELSWNEFPVILLDKKMYDLPFPAIISDNREGGYEATHYLMEQGHDRIGYLFGQDLHPQSVRHRYLGYLHALKERGLDFHTSNEDKHATNTYLLDYINEYQVTAFVCENDITAITAMNLLKQHGLSIPEDISLIGFDDIQAARLVHPSLTTIAQNFFEIGNIAGLLLIQWIETGVQPSDVNIPVRLIERESTKERVET